MPVGKKPFNPDETLHPLIAKLHVVLKSVVEIGRTLNFVREKVESPPNGDLSSSSAGAVVRALTPLQEQQKSVIKSVVQIGRTLNVLREEVLFLSGRPTSHTGESERASADGSLMREYILEARIREIYPTDLFPGIDKVSIPVGAINEESEHFNQVDLMYVAAIAKFRGCRRMFEIGTYQGRTTYHLTFAAPDALVYTLNLSPEDDPSVAEFIGCWFRGTERESQIRQIYMNSADFDPTPYAAQMDLVFIDGDHGYDAVKGDTQKAMQMLRPGGIIIWHDFAAKSPGVVRYLCEFSRQSPIFRLKHTCVALYIDGLDPEAYEPPARRLSWVTQPSS